MSFSSHSKVCCQTCLFLNQLKDLRQFNSELLSCSFKKSKIKVDYTVSSSQIMFNRCYCVFGDYLFFNLAQTRQSLSHSLPLCWQLKHRFASGIGYYNYNPYPQDRLDMLWILSTIAHCALENTHLRLIQTLVIHSESRNRARTYLS